MIQKGKRKRKEDIDYCPKKEKSVETTEKERERKTEMAKKVTNEKKNERNKYHIGEISKSKKKGVLYYIKK